MLKKPLIVWLKNLVSNFHGSYCCSYRKSVFLNNQSGRKPKITIPMRKHNQWFVPMLLSAISAVSVHAQVSTNTPPVAPPKPKAEWKSSAALGLTVTSGNSETTLGTATAGTDRKTDHNELSLGADGAYGTSKAHGQATTTTTANSVHGFSQYNQLFTERFYGYGRVEGRHDEVADLSYRAGLGVGAGYYFIKNTNTDFSVEVGPGYVFQKLGTNATDYAILRVADTFHQALSDRARLWQKAEWGPQVNRFNNYVITGELGIEADLTKDKKLALRSYVTDSFNNEPAPGFKKNDLTWVTAIAYKF
jgi:putative salt-induced outer membrane protein